MRRTIVALFLLPAVCSCSGSPSDADLEAVCADNTGKITISVTAGGGDELVNEDLLVRGTATHIGDLTIHELLVAGVPAKNEGFNFNTWSVTVPLQTIKSFRDDAGKNATLPITAVDACGRSSNATLEVRLGVPVQELKLEPDYPGDETFIPADGTTPLALLISAEPEAAGAKVQLEATVGGSFLGLSNGTAVLGGDKKSPASASVLFTATTPGVTVITASVDKSTRILPVRVAGPPTLLPSSATISPGQTIAVTVDSGGRVKDCQATPAAGVSVTSGSADLMATPAAVDENSDGKPDIKITADPSLAQQVTFILTCRDPFGQFVSGTFTATP